jgi:hypothetical protein
MHTCYFCIALLLFISFELGHSESLNDSISDIYQTSDDDYNSGIVIDSVPIDSENNNRSLRIKRKYSVTPKTPPKYCANNGTYEYGRCRCKYPYTGPKCFDFACEHGLSVGARYDPESPIWSKRCLCDDDWSGDLCNIPIADQCNGRGQYINGHCRCLDYYFGSRCQYVGKCEHGKLIEGICKCEYGWEGDYCSKIVCHHGYTTPETNYTVCVCPPRHTGQYCDECLLTGSHILPYPNCTKEMVPTLAKMSREKAHGQIISRLIFIGVALAVLLLLLLGMWILRWGRKRNTEDGGSIKGERASPLPPNHVDLQLLVRQKPAGIRFKRQISTYF